MSSFTSINPVDVFKNNFAEHISAKLSYWDSDLVLRYGNSIFFDQYPQKADELTGKVTMPQLWGDRYSVVSPFIQKAMQGEKQVFDYEYSLSSDSLLCTQYCLCPEMEFGKVIGIYSSENDISQYKKLENDLTDYNRIIGEQNDRLKNFANIVTHNLRSYSNNLDSITNILLETKDEDTKAQLMNFLSDISKSFSATIQNLNEIVDIFNHSQVQLERLNLKENVEKVLRVLNQQVESSGAQIHNLVPEDVFLNSHPAYLESIILNLISNALKYRHTDRKPQVEIDCMDEGEFVRLHIKDNGMGINLVRHGHDLFKMNKTFHKNPDAKGIGLFITKQQVEMMGGRIEVLSDGEQGSTFIVSFKK